MNFSINPYCIHALIENSFCAAEHRKGDSFGIVFRKGKNCLQQYICNRCCTPNEDEGQELFDYFLSESYFLESFIVL